MMQTIKIICCHEHIHEVQAHVFGQWAANRALADGDGACCVEVNDEWTVTMVPSGRCIHSVVGLLSEHTAARVAQALHEQVPALINWRHAKDDISYSRAVRDVATSIVLAVSTRLAERVEQLASDSWS